MSNISILSFYNFFYFVYITYIFDETLTEKYYWDSILSIEVLILSIQIVILSIEGQYWSTLKY